MSDLSSVRRDAVEQFLSRAEGMSDDNRGVLANEIAERFCVYLDKDLVMSLINFDVDIDHLSRNPSLRDCVDVCLCDILVNAMHEAWERREYIR